jgi:hypothetical protein
MNTSISHYKNNIYLHKMIYVSTPEDRRQELINKKEDNQVSSMVIPWGSLTNTP